MIEVKGLYKNFGNLEVLKDINKTINIIIDKKTNIAFSFDTAKINISK